MPTGKRKQAPRGDTLNSVLETAKAEWEAAFDAISEGIAITDKDGVVRRVNRALAALLGKDIRRLTGMSCCDMFPHHRASEGACPLRNYPDGRKGLIEVFFPEYRYHEERVSPIIKSGRKLGFVLTVRDITAEQMASEERKHLYLQMDESARKRKAVESQVAEIRSELALAEQAATVGRLAGIVFSEVDRSVRMLEEGLAFLAEKGEKGAGRGGSGSVLKELHTAAARTRTVLGHLASLRSSDTEGVNQIRADRAVSEVLADLEPQARAAGLAFEFKPSGPLAFFGNRTQVTAVISSLLLNAIEASKACACQPVTVATYREKAFVCIEVKDCGRGIEAAYLPQIFNPFFTTDTGGGRVGLGLTICQAIVQGHRGHVEVDSEPGKGTRIRVLFPAAEE